MPATIRKHVRYPELLLEMQAAVYGLYHMMDPEVFYNREDLWTVASEVTMNAQREQSAQPMEPNFVLMKLPGERVSEFVEMLPFTPANRNNLIGWIAGRSDEPNYGKTIVYNFPKTQARRRTAANRGAHRSERAAVGTVLAVEPARFERPPRQPDRHPDRTGAALRRADLPAGRAQPDAGAAPGRAGPAGSRRLRPDVRNGAGGAPREGPIHACARPGDVTTGAAAGLQQHGGTPPPATAPPAAPTSTRSSRTRRAISPTISVSPPRGGSGMPARRLEALKQKLDRVA